MNGTRSCLDPVGIRTATIQELNTSTLRELIPHFESFVESTGRMLKTGALPRRVVGTATVPLNYIFSVFLLG
jgi:hypothetical protein